MSKNAAIGFLSTLSLRRATHCNKIFLEWIFNFYPRSPCGERPSYSQHVRRPSGYFYPRSPCGERHGDGADYRPHFWISIHALLAESDHDSYVVMEATKIISIHALLAESDINTRLLILGPRVFLSTLSLRRATNSCTQEVPEKSISIHALLAESDLRRSKSFPA